MEIKEFNKFYHWVQAYLSAIKSGDSISKEQLEVIINKVKGVISELEKSENKGKEESDDDNLPF